MPKTFKDPEAQNQIAKGSKTMSSMSMDDMQNITGISGTMLFNGSGYLKMTVPNKTGFGDYKLEGSWFYIGHNILTQCFAGGCA